MSWNNTRDGREFQTQAPQPLNIIAWANGPGRSWEKIMSAESAKSTMTFRAFSASRNTGGLVPGALPRAFALRAHGALKSESRVLCSLPDHAWDHCFYLRSKIATAKQEAMLEFHPCSLDRSGHTTSVTWKAKSNGDKASMSSTEIMGRGKPIGWKPCICWLMQNHFALVICTKP